MLSTYPPFPSFTAIGAVIGDCTVVTQWHTHERAPLRRDGGGVCVDTAQHFSCIRIYSFSNARSGMNIVMIAVVWCGVVWCFITLYALRRSSLLRQAIRSLSGHRCQRSCLIVLLFLSRFLFELPLFQSLSVFLFVGLSACLCPSPPSPLALQQSYFLTF